MKWLTQKEIKARAKKSKQEAIKVSWEHWEQLATATITELIVARINRRFDLDEKYCGLCQRHRTKKYVCVDCPLDDANNTCCEEYLWADGSFQVFWEYRLHSDGFDKFVIWQKAARKMANKLKHLLKKQ